MYSKMKKLIIIFIMISVSNAIPNGTVGEYDALVFTQRTPGAAYIYIQNGIQNEGITNSIVMNYLTEYWPVLDPRRWVIHELRSINSNGDSLTDCKDHTGRELLFIETVPPEDFRDELKRKWPAFFSSLSEFDLWETMYNFYGSCIKPTPIAYFELAMDLLEDYNIPTIFANSAIFPGRNYTLSYIMNSITRTLGTRVYVKCLPRQRRQMDEQFLIEVQICFDKRYRLIDCNCPVNMLCVNNKTVIYTGWPNN